MPRIPATVRRQELLAIVLALTAGYVDGFGLIALGTFLSFMSGNTTQAGTALGQGAPAVAAPAMIAIASFVVGVVVAALLEHRRNARTRAALTAASGVVLAVVALGTRTQWIGVLPSIAVVSMVMGVLTNTLTRLGNEPTSFTFVTGTLNRAGRHLAAAAACEPLGDPAGPWDSHLRRALLLGALWTSFLGGAILAGAAVPRLTEWTLLPPALLLTAIGLAGIAGGGRTDESARNASP